MRTSWEAITRPTTASHWGEQSVAIQCLQDRALLPGQAQGIGISDSNYTKVQKSGGGQVKAERKG